MSRSGVYTSETHQVTPMALRAEQVCSYDLDEVDQRWLAAVNGERSLTGEIAYEDLKTMTLCENVLVSFAGSSTISELEMERSMEELEKQASGKISSILKTNDESDDLDDSVICDVCRSVRVFKNGFAVLTTVF